MDEKNKREKAINRFHIFAMSNLAVIFAFGQKRILMVPFLSSMHFGIKLTLFTGFYTKDHWQIDCISSFLMFLRQGTGWSRSNSAVDNITECIDFLLL